MQNKIPDRLRINIKIEKKVFLFNTTCKLLNFFTNCLTSNVGLILNKTLTLLFLLMVSFVDLSYQVTYGAVGPVAFLIASLITHDINVCTLLFIQLAQDSFNSCGN